MEDVLERYTAAALAGARAKAARIAAELAGADPSPVPVIEGLLAPSQREIGRRWQHLLCSVGDEHAATFVTESVLASISVGAEPHPDRGTIVVACAEGEWHALPARMASELLIQQRWNVVYLGPATPASQLRAYLAGVEADAVAVSATMPSNLPGAARSVRVARRLGMPVIVGGAAFGADGRRARAIGADGWSAGARDVLDLSAVLWDEVVEPDPGGAWVALEDRRAELVRSAVERLGEQASMRSTSASWMRQLEAYVDDIVGVAIAAVLCADPSIVVEHRAWLDDLVVSHTFPREIALSGYAAVEAAIGEVSAEAAGLIAAVR